MAMIMGRKNRLIICLVLLLFLLGCSSHSAQYEEKGYNLDYAKDIDEKLGDSISEETKIQLLENEKALKATVNENNPTKQNMEAISGFVTKNSAILTDKQFETLFGVKKMPQFSPNR